MHIEKEEEGKPFGSQVRSFLSTSKLKHKHKHLQRKRERHKKGDGKGKHDFILIETALKFPGHFTVHTSLCTSKTGFFVFSKHKSSAYFNFLSSLTATSSILEEPKPLVLTYKTSENRESHVQLSEVTTWHLSPSYFHINSTLTASFMIDKKTGSTVQWVCISHPCDCTDHNISKRNEK